MSESSPSKSAIEFLPELPELGPYLSDLLRTLDLKDVVFLGDNPNLDFENEELCHRHVPLPLVWDDSNANLPEVNDLGDLTASILVLPGTLDFASDPQGTLGLVKAALEVAPLAMICVRESELVAPVLPVSDPAIAHWTFSEFEELLKNEGIAPAWGGLTMSNRVFFERNHSVFLLTKNESRSKKVADLMSTGIRSFTFAPGFGTSDEETRPARVAICTDEIFGPSSNGGIGTAYTAMAEFLARGGHEVTVFFSGDVTSREPIEYWIDFYQEKNIKVIPLALDRVEDLPWQDEYMRRSHVIYTALREACDKQAFDAVHFPECNAQGFYTILAKHQGLAFADTVLCIGTHGNTRWVYDGHGMEFDSTYQLANDFMEQVCIRWCDVLVSPSLYLVYWMKREGWDLPNAWYGQQNLQPFTARGEDSRRDEPFPMRTDVAELVFFGRLEARKGLVPFCDALDLLAAGGNKIPPFEVTFMGKEVLVGTKASGLYLQERADSGHWNFEWKILGDFNQDKAVGYLQGDRRVAIIPSLQDNSPYTVLECIGLGIPFLSQRIGGIPELIDPRDVAQCTFYARTPERRPEAIAKSIQRILTTGIRAARRAVAATDTDAGWVDFHSSIVKTRGDQKAVAPAAPTASIDALILATPIDTLKSILDCANSILEQDHKPVGVRVALIEADQEETEEFRDNFLDVLKENEIELLICDGAETPSVWLSRHIARSSADHVLLAHSRTTSLPGELSTLARVVETTGADLLTGFLQPYVAEPREPGGLEKRDANYFPIGAAALLPLYANTYGIGHLLVAKKVISSLLEESPRVLDPTSFGNVITLATAAGFEHEVVPEFLLTYVQDDRNGIHVNGMPVSKGVKKAMAHVLPPSMRGLSNFVQGTGSEAVHIQGQLFDIKHKLREEFPGLQHELHSQSEWLKNREQEITRMDTELAKQLGEATKYKKKAEELKQKLREEELKKKLVLKDNEHLTYRLNQKVSQKVKRVFGGKAKEPKKA